ncbi:Proteasome adapter and scaffold protein ECM29 [Phytophthora citrophthora]|uniref:Proteasome adapter and scaffold protein ECM29 n=1 Tax=Phytophthora citrophthora TaxID=4793 RepID=A0AAD9GPN8_9STRA|nr:Proteasome adapter and scaffold protein ECM29 [Phytophthora citrophthora]
MAGPTLPLDALCQVLQQNELSVFSYNLALLFIEIGFEAASADEKTRVLAVIVKQTSTFSAANQETFFKLLVHALPFNASAIVPNRKKTSEGVEEHQEQREAVASLGDGEAMEVYERDANVDAVLDFVLDFVLYEFPSSTTVGATNYGLMTPRVERLQRVKVTELTREALYEHQLHALRLVKEMDIPVKLKIPVYLAGSASFHHAVKAFSEEQLSRVVKYEEKELEDTDVMRRLMVLVLGSQVAQSSGGFEGADAILLTNRARLADASILQTLSLLMVSKAATNALPVLLQLLCQLMFGTESSRPPNVANKIKLASVRLCQWTFHHCQLSLLEGLLGPVLFPTLLRLLMNPHTESEASSMEFVREFRQGVYESLLVLSTRAPTLVATTEQAFQVLLVRCLAEEESRTGAGANALKTFTSFASAYAAAAAPEVRSKVHQELIALLNGSKLFEPGKNYARVRAAIAAWCAELLTVSVSDEDDGITMRFAVLRLGAVPDEDTRRLSDKALFAKPLPSTSALARSLQVNFPQKDLKISMHDAGAAESAIRFCVEIMKASQDRINQDVSERRCVVEYIVHTLLRSEAAKASASTSSLVFETAASALVEICGFDAESVGVTLGCHVTELFDVVTVSRDRGFLSNIATIVAVTCSVGAFTSSQVVSTFIATGMKKNVDSKSLAMTQPGALYILGSALNVLGCDPAFANAASHEEMRLVLSCYQEMSDLLGAKVEESSNFAAYPRSELAQNEQVGMIRNVMDGIGLSGTIKSFLLNSRDTGGEWGQLKAKTIANLKAVVDWKLKAVHFDDQLSSKLASLQRAAVENICRIVSGLPGAGINSEILSGLEAVLDALFELGDNADADFQFAVGEALVALGTHDAKEKFTADRTIKYSAFTENRAAFIFERILVDYAGSRQPKVRRNATIWLLCVCAAGLVPSTGDSDVSSWRSVFVSPAYSQSVLEVHEFLVTMLNDANEVAKESAVKGLAYLRLRAPTDDMGIQFSDSLFRRLRCFRAFAATADSAAADENGASNERSNEATTATAPSNSSSSSSTVENAAYREVSNVAADVGDPELMYALLYLSTSDPIWESLTSASTSTPVTVLLPTAFSFIATDKEFRASIVAKAGSEWMAEDYSNRTQLVPWLFLLKFHSNSKVAAVMGKLWEFAKGNAATTSEEKTLLRQNWDLLFQFALARLENARNFKYREAACSALVDLLQGAEAEELRSDFLRLWKTASRAVDDVMEAVALSGAKLYRYLGELSLRVAANDAMCRSQLLEFLVEDGIVSKNTICRALSIDLLLRLVKTLKAESMQDRLAPLLLKLLEYLSSLEMPELQYAQFHVEKKDQLERLRVSISQSGPVGQLLELSTTRLKELADSPACVAVVTDVVRGVANLLKFGVGLNTRVGTANFVVTLANELPFELRKCNGAELLLRRVFIPYIGAKTAAENDQYGDEESRYGDANGGNPADGADAGLTSTSGLTDGLVIQSYSRAASYLCPLVEAGTVRDYVRSGIFAFNKASTKTSSPSSSPQSQSDEEVEGGDLDKTSAKSPQVYTSRFLLISALAMKDLVKKVPPIADAGSVVSDDLRNSWYCTYVFPAAFIGQFAATNVLKSSWTAVLDELPPTILYAPTSLSAVLSAIALLLAHPAWDTRRQAARALQAIFGSSTYSSRLSEEQVERIWQGLIDAVPGRLWKGKGVILESIVSLAALKVKSKSANTDTKWMENLSLLLVEECDRAWKNQDLAYLESAIINLGGLTALLPGEQGGLAGSNVQLLRDGYATWMIGNEAESSDATKRSLPPLLIKCVFEAIAVMWPALGGEDNVTAQETLLWLCTSTESPHLAVWSIRKAIFQALAVVVAHAPVEALVKGKGVLERAVDTCCGSFGVEDGKYSMVRVAAAGALTALTKRAASNSDLALKMVVQRERVLAAVQVLLASEEASEQQAAFHLKSQLLQMS